MTKSEMIDQVARKARMPKRAAAEATTESPEMTALKEQNKAQAEQIKVLTEKVDKLTKIVEDLVKLQSVEDPEKKKTLLEQIVAAIKAVALLSVIGGSEPLQSVGASH